MDRRGTILLLGAGALLVAAACGDDDASGDAGSGDGAIDPGPARAVLDFGADVSTPEGFFDIPFPSDLRLTADGRPDLSGFPNPLNLEIIEDVRTIAERRPGWPTIPVGYFRFTARPAELDGAEVIPASPDAPAMLIDVDPDSADRGSLVPLVALTLANDRYTGESLLALAPRPGFVLHPERTYAFVVMRSLGDSVGRPLEVPEALSQLRAGTAPAGARGADAVPLYAPLWETLEAAGLDGAEVAAATVFTTGDVVAELHDLSNRLLVREDVTIEALRLDPGDGIAHDRYCELVGTMEVPHFQRGTPPFNEEGTFEFGPDGLPIEQFRETARIVLTIPKAPMPASGYPLMIYFHGSGGIASQIVDRGPAGPDGVNARGEGPAHVIAEHGFAAVGASLPLSPDRLFGASYLAYLNLDNLAAFPDTFRQGVIEQRLMIEALTTLEITPAMLGGCAGPELPPGETAYRFDADAFVGIGQSMGGMYTNMIGAVEPRLSALVPTGAGGFWGFFILETDLLEASGLLGVVLGTRGQDLSFMHPVLSLLEIGWESAEPLVYTPRLSRRPLEGIPARPVYEPVGQGDSFFPTEVYDAFALGYGHPQAGEVVWPETQEALALAGLDGITSYPVAANLTNGRGETYTSALVQSAGDGFSDPHVIFMQLADIRYQWGCFLSTAVQTGTAVIPAPAPEGTACPTM